MKRIFSFYKIILLLAILLFLNNYGICQNEDEHTNEQDSTKAAQINFGVDLVSRFIWRGYDYGNSPAIQPNFSFSVAGFKIGAWGSYGVSNFEQSINDSTTVNMGHYAEFDLFMAYTFKWFTLGITDYFVPNPLSPNTGNKYFNYNKYTTTHTFEACLSFDGTEKVPLQLFVGTLFYGEDLAKDASGKYTERSKNNYSTYLEASYLFTLKKIGIDIKPFIGGIPFGSDWYGNSAGIVNVGFTASKSIKITSDFSIPVFTSVVTNPQAQSVFLVFGLTL